MSNFIPMVYAVLKDKGVDTKGMSADDAVKKYNELNGKDGGYDTESGDQVKKDKYQKYVVTFKWEKSNPANWREQAGTIGRRSFETKKEAEDFFETNKGTVLPFKLLGQLENGENETVKDYGNYKKGQKFSTAVMEKHV